jgi:hypothetical protein
MQNFDVIYFDKRKRKLVSEIELLYSLSLDPRSPITPGFLGPLTTLFN